MSVTLKLHNIWQRQGLERDYTNSFPVRFSSRSKAWCCIRNSFQIQLVFYKPEKHKTCLFFLIEERTHLALCCNCELILLQNQGSLVSSCQPQRQVQSHSDYREGSYKAVLGLWDAGALAPAASATGRRGPRFPSENRSPVQKVPSSHFLREMDYEWEKREALCTYMDKSSPNLPFISHIFEIHFLILICEVFILRSHNTGNYCEFGYCSARTFDYQNIIGSYHDPHNLPAAQQLTRAVTLEGFILHKCLVDKSPGGAGVSTDEKSKNE